MDKSNFVGYFDIDPVMVSRFGNDAVTDIELKKVNGESIFRLKNFLSSDEVTSLISSVDSHPQVPVGRDGYVKNYQAGDDVCSLRSTIYSEDLSGIFYERLRHCVFDRNNIYVSSACVFYPVGVNPAMRFIDYPGGGWLVPHYDFPYKASENEMSLLSLVVFLTSNDEGGATRFVKEYRDGDDSDWSRKAEEREILMTLNPEAGDAILFPHHLLHEGQLTKERKVILRTDIMYQGANKNE